MTGQVNAEIMTRLSVDGSNFKKEMEAATQRTRNFAKQQRAAANDASALTKSTGRLGKSAGQASIQFQQFFGQLQGGVNPMVALSQQSADLGFVLGVPLLGAVVSIGAALSTFLLPNLFESEEKTDDLVQKTKELRGEYILTAQQQKLLAIEEQKANKERQKRVEEINKEIARLEKLQTTQENQRDGSGIGRSDAANQSTAQKRLDETIAKLTALRVELEQLQIESGELTLAIDATDTVKELTQEIQIAALTLNGSAVEAEKLKFALSQGATSFELLNPEAQVLYEQLQLINREQQKSIDLQREQAQSFNALSGLDRQLNADNSLEGQNASRIALIESLALSEEQIQASGYSSLLDLQEDYISQSNALYEQQVLDRENAEFEVFERRLKLAEDQAKRLQDIEAAKVEANKKTARDDFLTNLQTATSQSKKLAGIIKAAAIANATIKTYEAVNNALAAPFPPPIPQIFAAAALAAGLTNIQKIKAQPIAGARALGGPVTGGRSYLVGERGPELFTPGATGQITSNENMKRAMNTRSSKRPLNATFIGNIPRRETRRLTSRVLKEMERAERR